MPKLRASRTNLRLLAIVAPVAIQQAAADGNQPAGAPTFAALAYSGGVLPGYTAQLDRDVVIDLAGMKPVRNLVANLDHHAGHRVGHATDVVNDTKTLKVEGVLSAATPHRDEVVGSSRDGFSWEVSIETKLNKLAPLAAGQTAVVNGQTVTGPLYIARKSQLTGLAFVSQGADEGNSVSIAAAAAGEKAMNEFEKWLEAKGWDASELSGEQQATLKATFDAEQAAKNGGGKKEPEAPLTLEAAVAARKRENERIDAITRLADQTMLAGPQHIPQIEAAAREAIRQSWDAERFELELLRATRPQSSHFLPRSGMGEVSDQVIEAAVCTAGGLETIEKQFDERTLEAAHRQWRNGLGLSELVLMFARRNGYDGLNLRNLQPALKAAFAGHELRAGVGSPSTTSLPGILGNVANKFLRVGFDAVDAAWRMITATRPVNDFKTITSYTLTGGLTYELVPAGGEIKHGQLGERSYTNKADTYAKMLGIDRRDLINDDLGALTTAGRRLGRGAALKINDVFWSTFLNNAAFFTGGNNNVITGAGSALSLASLEDADEKFRLQTDPDGLPLGIMPRKLLVPTALRITALNLMASLKVVSTTTANAPLPDANPFAGAFDVVSSPYMQNAAYTGNSAIAWYVLADPNDLPAIETCFLFGQESPTVETADADFNTLGIALRGFHDFGVALQEFRAGVRAAGA